MRKGGLNRKGGGVRHNFNTFVSMIIVRGGNALIQEKTAEIRDKMKHALLLLMEAADLSIAIVKDEDGRGPPMKALWRILSENSCVTPKTNLGKRA